MRFRWGEFGKDLRGTREDMFMSLREASKKLKIDKATWSRAENGKPIEAPTFVFLCAWMSNDPSIYLYRQP